MGGHAFAELYVNPHTNQRYPARYCPRLPTPIYTAIRDEVVKKLSVIFDKVIVPFPHPEKEDHGDIDIFVCGPKDDLANKRTIYDLRLDIAQHLGVDRSMCNKSQTGFFAVLVPATITSLGSIPEPVWPEKAKSQRKGKDAEKEDSGVDMQDTARQGTNTAEADQDVAKMTVKELEVGLGSSKKYWVQVDIQLVDAPSQLEWRQFKIAHATFHNILAYGLRPAGFIFMNSGLYVRSPGPDRPFGPDAPKTPLVFLTNDVYRMLEFFNLPAGPYGRPFPTRDEYWIYATSARYYSRDRIQLGVSPGLKEESEEEPKASQKKKKSRPRKEIKNKDSVDDTTKGKKKRTRHDHLAQRAAWPQFTDEWVPANPHIGTSRLNVEDIFEDALSFFDTKARYYVAWNSYVMEREDELFWDEAFVRLQAARYTEMVSQDKIEIHTHSGVSLEEAEERVIADLTLVIFPKSEKVQEKAAVERKQKLMDHIHVHINEVIRILKRRVDFETFEGYGKYPVILDIPQMDESKHPKWLAQSEQGGYTREELLGWIVFHGFRLQENERARTRPEREAKDLEKLAEKKMKVMKKCPVDSAMYAYLCSVKLGLYQKLQRVQRLKDSLKAKQKATIWTRKSPMAIGVVPGCNLAAQSSDSS
ncbi:hypothetical protein E6O75_ATG05347 [Venturia nashicola]|uniref:Uncharacterized protein n=1 Tax=Venturia nashicola TaxID=86259 RepID=A0A4Z1NWP5_9PEZI|nr:hypothetical protein E6O75_ATG05347 [Venturia nashicola]